MQTTGKGSRRWRRVLLGFTLPAILIFGATLVYLFSTGASVSASSILGPGNSAVSNAKVTLLVNINHQQQHGVDLLWLVQMAFKGQFWRPSCLLFCNNGVSYYLDPAPLITNYGRDFEQCKVFGSSSNAITCVSADIASVVGISADSTAPASSDTYASAGPCKTGVILNTNGFSPVAGTVSPGNAGTSVATSVTNQFTATGAQSNLQAACLLTETLSGSHIIVYAEGTFGPDNLASGNSITITWQVTRA